jgi:ABC-type glycerol-3-phosphate transport system substrate-binding protein
VDNCGWREIYPLMDDKKNAAIMMFAWPTWFIADLMNNPHQNKLVGLMQLTEHPVLGFWSFAIPKKLKYANEAMKVILALTTAPEIQLLMAQAGLVPVLDDIDVGRLKKQNPFWEENYDVIRDALRDARPRPKSKQWRKIEIELAKQIRAGQFKSIDHLFRFTKCHFQQ